MISRTLISMALQATLVGAPLAQSAVAADLLEVWQAAKGHDPEYRAAQSEQSAGGARRNLGDTLLKPSVNLVVSAGVVAQSTALTGAQFSTAGMGTFNNANFNTSITSGTQTKYALQANQPLYDRELSAQKGQLELSADVTDMGMIAADRALIMRVAQNYFDALKTQAGINLLQEQQQAVANTYAEINRRQNLGDASKLDLQVTASQVEAIKAKLLQAQLAHENNMLSLTELTGKAVQVNVLGENFNPADMTTGEINAWTNKAKANNPQLKMLALQEQLKRAEIDKFKSGYSPKINLVAQIERADANGSGDYGSASNSASNKMLALQLNVPLTDGYRAARNDEAYHMAEKAKREFERAALEIEKQISSTWHALASGKARLDSFNKIVALNRDRLNATERFHRQGSRTTLELLGAQSDYISSKMVLLEEQINLIVNRIRLAALAGDISDQDLISANRFIAKK